MSCFSRLGLILYITPIPPVGFKCFAIGAIKMRFTLNPAVYAGCNLWHGKCVYKGMILFFSTLIVLVGVQELVNGGFVSRDH
jgi:hypothetical protein